MTDHVRWIIVYSVWSGLAVFGATVGALVVATGLDMLRKKD
jgi:hypothetical protein